MAEEFPIEQSPGNRVVFQDTSVDGSLTITVWMDDEPTTSFMENFGGMGTVRIYHTHSALLYHEERIALSSSAIFGPGPTDDEIEKWSTLISIL